MSSFRAARRASRTAVVLLAAASLTALAACGGGGSSDVVGAAASAGAANGSGGALNLYGFSVAKTGFDKVIPLWNATSDGKGVAFQESYGASGDQSRKVAAGAAADVVSFSVEPDMTRLVKAGLVANDWSSSANQGGIAFGSVVVIVVRKGNPKGIKTWDDLLKPGIQVVTPNPFSSGSAKWNLLAPYAVKSDGGKDPAAGLAYLTSLIDDHIKIQPKSGREASDAFLQGQGDVLLSYENEAIFLEKAGDPVRALRAGRDVQDREPRRGGLVEQAVGQGAGLRRLPLLDRSRADALAKAGYRPVDPTVAQQYASSFPAPQKLWTIADLGGWSTVDPALFDKDKGTIAKIYNNASK